MKTHPDNIAADVPDQYFPLVAGGEFIERNGPLYVRREGQEVRFAMRVEPRHCNPMAILHGGMMASFCDMLLPMALRLTTRELSDRFLPTISLQIDYLAPSPLGSWVEGKADLLRSTRSLVFAQGLVTADGVPCARASGVFKIGPVMPDESPT